MPIKLDIINHGTIGRSRAWHKRYHDMVHVVLEEIPYHVNIDDMEEVAMEISTLFLSELICYTTPRDKYPLCETIPYPKLLNFLEQRTCPVAEIVRKMGYSLKKSIF